MENKILPELNSPAMNLMVGNTSGLPTLISKLFPATTKKVTPDDGALSLFLGTWKIKKVAEYAEGEARIAKANREALGAVLDGVHEYLTHSSRIADTLMEFEHRKTMRSLEIQEKQADIYMKNAQAQMMGFEAKSAEIDYNIREEQYKKMKEEG